MDDLENPVLRAKLAPYRRSTWIPDVGNGAGAPDASRLGGAPWLRSGETWPACPSCGRPMHLFVQLNARDLPPPGAQALEGGMLQFFYCIREDPTCELECEGWAPFARNTLLRLIPRDDLGGGAAASAGAQAFPPKRITGWSEATDYPNWEEAENRGLQLSDEEADALTDGDFPRAGEKLLGWPYWVQGVEYPDCPECGARMEMLFQIDSERHLPYRFGDSGAGHVTQCPRHRDRLAFGWACC